MITPKEYQRQLDQLLNLADSAKIPTPITEEPVFNVDLNTREIEIPKQFRNLAVYSDHMAETIWFAVDRYYDGVDLYRKRVAIQYVNALGEEGLDILDTYDHNVSGDRQSDVYNSDDDRGRYNKISEGEILIAWKLDYAVTKASGPIEFSLRFFEVDDESQTTLSYNLTTRTASVNILNGLYITENSANPVLPKTKLEDLVDKIYEAYAQGEITVINYDDINKNTLPVIDTTLVYGNIDSKEFEIAHYPNLLDKPTLNEGIFTGAMTSRNLVISTNENNEITDISVGIDVDTDFSLTSENPVQNKVVSGKFEKTDSSLLELSGKIAALEELFGELTFVPIDILSFVVVPNIKEKGDEAVGTQLTWIYNQDKNPATLLLNDTPLPLTAKEHTINTPITETTTFTLKAVDTFGNSATKDTTLHFVDAIYYNSAPIPVEYNSDFIKSLSTRALSTEKAISLEFEVADGSYMYICTPESNGDYTFKTGGFDGGFGGKPVATVEFTNEFGHTETYRIYKSDNTNLGKTKVELS